MKALLCFPPGWHPIMPHLALPSLAAYLRGKGIQVIQKDLNIELFDEILSRHHLSSLLHRLGREQKARRIDTSAAPPADMIAWAFTEGRGLVSEIEQAKATVRSPHFYEAAGLPAMLALHDGLRLASLPHYPSEIHLTGYQSAYPADASGAILAALRDRQHNLFYDLFARLFVPQIVRERPDIVGISATSSSQIVAAFTLAQLIKESSPRTHVTLGGKMMTCWRELLPEALQHFPFVDSVIFYAGEEPLFQLIEALAGGKSLSTVPNLLYREGTRLRQSEQIPPGARSALSVSDLPAPDFDGLPLSRYLAPEKVLPVATSRGCYWHRCAFCNVGYQESSVYEEKQAEQVCAEMMSLAQRWNVRHFFFSDEAVSPRMLKHLSRRLIEQDAELYWTCAARFEPGLDAATLQQMAESGCRMLMFGLESASPRVLERMHKGIQLEQAARILRESAEAGIWNHLFFFFGFPGERAEESEETLRFLHAQQPSIHSLCSGTFLLERYAQVEQHPERYGVTRIVRPRDRDLAYYYDYETSSGLSSQEAERAEACFLDRLPNKELAQVYFHDAYRFLYASRFERGTPFPPMLPAER